eukprot:8568728-Alexandrium_andersonii.AAC.1
MRLQHADGAEGGLGIRCPRVPEGVAVAVAAHALPEDLAHSLAPPCLFDFGLARLDRLPSLIPSETGRSRQPLGNGHRGLSGGELDS